MLKLKNNIAILLSFAIVLLILYSIASFIGIGFLSILGFEYDSISSILIFFLFYFIIGIPIDLISILAVNVFTVTKQLTKVQYKILHAVVDILITAYTVGIIDFFMDSITIPFSTQILFGVFMYIFEIVAPFRKQTIIKTSIKR